MESEETVYEKAKLLKNADFASRLLRESTSFHDSCDTSGFKCDSISNYMVFL